MMDLGAFVKWLHPIIRETVARDKHCKSYEGDIRVEVDDIFCDPPEARLTLLMYVIAPSGREHTWAGASVEECCGKAHADITRWLAEAKADQ